VYALRRDRSVRLTYERRGSGPRCRGRPIAGLANPARGKSKLLTLPVKKRGLWTKKVRAGDGRKKAGSLRQLDAGKESFGSPFLKGKSFSVLGKREVTRFYLRTSSSGKTCFGEKGWTGVQGPRSPKTTGGGSALRGQRAAVGGCWQKGN